LFDYVSRRCRLDGLLLCSEEEGAVKSIVGTSDASSSLLSGSAKVGPNVPFATLLML